MTTTSSSLVCCRGPLRSILPVQGTWLATLDSAYVGEEPGRAGYPGVDAHLYVGRRDLLLREPRSAQAVLDTDYLAELERRATAIEAPADSRMHPDVAFQLELRKKAS